MLRTKRSEEISITALFAAAIVATVLIAGAPAHAGDRHHGNISITADDSRDITTCGQIKIEFDGDSTARDEQRFTLAKNADSRLEIHLNGPSGVSVVGWDRDDYAITACKAAAGSSDASAQRRLNDISVTIYNSRITQRGSGSDDSWLVYYIVQAPHGAVLDMSSENGELRFRRVSGTIDARAENGPIQLRDCSGTARVETENGPVAFAGQSGDFHLQAHNGPMEVRLTGSKWTGAGLDASTENGPLSLRFPDGYSSGVSVESRGYSPLTCKAQACDQSHGTWGDNDRTIHIGGDKAVVRLHTENGPVEIKSASAHDDTSDDDDDGTV